MIWPNNSRLLRPQSARTRTMKQCSRLHWRGRGPVPNPGEDVFEKVIICANGDYVATGYMFVAGIRRGFACRINSANGNIIWTFNSANSSSGEIFWDVIETTNNTTIVAK